MIGIVQSIFSCQHKERKVKRIDDGIWWLYKLICKRCRVTLKTELVYKAGLEE